MKVGAVEIVVLAILGSCNGYIHQSDYKRHPDAVLVSNPHYLTPYLRTLSLLHKGVSLQLNMNELRVGKNGKIKTKYTNNYRTYKPNPPAVALSDPRTLPVYLKVLSALHGGVKLDFELKPATREHELPTNELNERTVRLDEAEDTRDTVLKSDPRTLVPYLRILSVLHKGASLDLDMSELRVGRNGKIKPRRGGRSHPDHGVPVAVAHPKTLIHYLKVLSNIHKGVKVDFDVKNHDYLVTSRGLRDGDQSDQSQLEEEEVPAKGPLKTILLKYRDQE